MPSVYQDPVQTLVGTPGTYTLVVASPSGGAWLAEGATVVRLNSDGCSCTQSGCGHVHAALRMQTTGDWPDSEAWRVVSATLDTTSCTLVLPRNDDTRRRDVKVARLQALPNAFRVRLSAVNKLRLQGFDAPLCGGMVRFSQPSMRACTCGGVPCLHSELVDLALQRGWQPHSNAWLMGQRCLGRAFRAWLRERRGATREEAATATLVPDSQVAYFKANELDSPQGLLQVGAVMCWQDLTCMVSTMLAVTTTGTLESKKASSLGEHTDLNGARADLQAWRLQEPHPPARHPPARHAYFSDTLPRRGSRDARVELERMHEHLPRQRADEWRANAPDQQRHCPHCSCGAGRMSSRSR